MRKFTTEHTVYDFDELSDDAKRKGPKFTSGSRVTRMTLSFWRDTISMSFTAKSWICTY